MSIFFWFGRRFIATTALLHCFSSMKFGGVSHSELDEVLCWQMLRFKWARFQMSCVFANLQCLNFQELTRPYIMSDISDMKVHMCRKCWLVTDSWSMDHWECVAHSCVFIALGE